MNNTKATNHSPTLKVLRYPDDGILRTVAKSRNANTKSIIGGLTDCITYAHYNSDFFCIVMYGCESEVIGYAGFYRHSSDKAKWFYAYLWVDSKYRLKGYAQEIVKYGIEHLIQSDARELFCTVDPSNAVSLHIQRKMGFKEIVPEPFDDFTVDDCLMFRLELRHDFNTVSISEVYLSFVCELIVSSNPNTVYDLPKLYSETKKALIDGPQANEQSYIIRKGIVPTGFVQLRPFGHGKMRIMRLLISEKYRHLGIEEWALGAV